VTSFGAFWYTATIGKYRLTLLVHPANWTFLQSSFPRAGYLLGEAAEEIAAGARLTGLLVALGFLGQPLGALG
jgi:hypothetical protein